MKLKLLYTKRKVENRAFFDLVWEWEDVLQQVLNLKFFYEESANDLIFPPIKNKYVRKICNRVPFIKDIFVYPKDLGLRFDMWTWLMPQRRPNAKRIIPWVIDFFVDEKELAQFVQSYKECPLVLISNKEAYEWLLAHGEQTSQLKLAHLSLSIPDRYRISATTSFEKKFDVVLLGRQNPLMQKWFEQYVQEHPNLTYAYPVGDKRSYYDNNGNYVCDAVSRDDYIALTRQSRIGFFSTPDIDTDHVRSKGFDQVTPRFLELIAAGTHIIARYKPNPDTDYYQLSAFSPSVQNYEEFETAMNYALTHDVDMKKYATYLQQHYTSVRAQQLLEILQKYD